MDRFEIDVDGAQPEDTPDVLYKYRRFDADGYHLGLIQNAELWFTSARSFNDPFDSALHYRFEDDPPGIQMKWALGVVSREFPHLSHSARTEKARRFVHEFNSNPSGLHSFKKNYVETNYHRFGICCLTPKKDDLLMWAHYSHNHEGFCVGIDTSKLWVIQHEMAESKQLLDLVRILYEEKIPEINFFSSMISKDWHVDMIRLLTTKSIHWCYEEEYRIIYWDHSNSALLVGHDAIAEVILGCRIKKNRRKVLDLYSGLNPVPTLLQARKH